MLAWSIHGSKYRPCTVHALSFTPDIASDVLRRFAFSQQHRTDLLERERVLVAEENVIPQENRFYAGGEANFEGEKAKLKKT